MESVLAMTVLSVLNRKSNGTFLRIPTSCDVDFQKY